MNLACYAMGWKLLGRQFIAYSILSSASFSLSYRICEQFPPLWPQLADMPLTASLLGAVFVGVGAGLCVRIGGAPGGDDALAMSLSHVTHIKIQWIYLLSDFAVLVLSLHSHGWLKTGLEAFSSIWRRSSAKMSADNLIETPTMGFPSFSATTQ